MPQQGGSGTAYLDTIRRDEGADACIRAFGSACESDRRQAAGMLNDPQLTFGSLFILAPQIAQYGLARSLSPRNAAALHAAGLAGGIAPGRNDAERAALKWMLETGRADDGMSDDFEAALERAASVLINTYHDADILPSVVDMIFERSRKGHNIHSLVWAAFQSRSPEVLKLIAQRLHTADEPDARLSCSLLGIDEPAGGAAAEYQKRHEAYLRWLNENDPYLYFTGESLQYASRPAVCAVDLERKYIQRGTPRYDRQPVSPADMGERNALAAFAALKPDDRALLSRYSHQLHARDASGWKTWVRSPIEEQVQTAKLSRGNIDDYGLGKFV